MAVQTAYRKTPQAQNAGRGGAVSAASPPVPEPPGDWLFSIPAVLRKSLLYKVELRDC